MKHFNSGGSLRKESAERQRWDLWQPTTRQWGPNREGVAQWRAVTPYLSAIFPKALLIGLIGLFIMTGTVLAQAPDAEVDFFIVPPPEPKNYTVGDTITLRLEVTHPADSNVQLPLVEAVWGDFEVVRQGGQETLSNGNGTATTGKDIVVALFEPGQYETPPILVEHMKNDGSAEELGAPVIRLEIASILIEGDTELRDIKPQAILPVPPLWPLLLAGACLTVLLSTGVFLGGRWAYNRWWRKELVPAVPIPVIDTRPPEVIAYSELDRIEAMDLPAKAQFKDHYSLVTDCLRRYIEGRYQFPALEQTTSEIRSSFRKAALSKEIVSIFLNLFNLSDLVKFARWRPDKQDAYDLVAEARYLVGATTPKPEPVQTVASGETPKRELR